MKTIYIKYNKERLPQYQTVTKIVEDNSNRWVVKLPLCAAALDHINTIYVNYQLLMKSYPNIRLSKPTLLKDELQFEMLNGVSFDKLLRDSLDAQNKVLFFDLIDKYVGYVNSFIFQPQVKFEPCDKFIEIFGNHIFNQVQDVIRVANIDLIFSNLFVFNSEITQIDYEWIFPSAIPKNFLIWRSIIVFFAYHDAEYLNLINIYDALSHVGISASDHEIYLSMDKSFQRSVYGNDGKYLLNNKWLQLRDNLLAILNDKIQELALKEKEIRIIRESNTYKFGTIIRKIIYKIIRKN